MTLHLITTQPELVEFCASVEGGAFIAVDTEFLRDKTYFPKLCLLQIASPERAAVIDPLAANIDLSPVFALMQKESLVKVFHAARQDIEIFHLLSGHIPTPLFDTQIAASVLGFGEAAGYDALVKSVTGHSLDKSSRFTDWSARPLSDRQLEYAQGDVTHLCVVYETLLAKLKHSGRESWTLEEHAQLTDPALYKPDPNNAWQRLKVGTMRPKQLAVLRELAKWREIEARERDVPRGRILKDETLLEIAGSQPRSEADLARMRGIGHINPQRVAAILACVETALALPASSYPEANRWTKPPAHVTAALPLLQMLLKITADAEGIAPSLIAGRDELEQIAEHPDTPALTGWRHDIFGKRAQALMQGKLKLSLDPKKGEVRMEEAL